MTAYGADKVEVRWLPYIIDPGTKADGEDYNAYCRRRWGGDGWTYELREMGRDEGAAFSNWKWWPATMQCHRLIHFAEKKGVTSSHSNAAIFQALYEEGQNVSLNEVLAGIAVKKLGLDQREVLQYLQSSQDCEVVAKQIEMGRRKYNISGVPFFIVGPSDGRQRPYGISGAEEADTFLKIFEEFDQHK